MHARKPFSTESTRKKCGFESPETYDERNPSQDSTSKQGLNGLSTSKIKIYLTIQFVW